MLIYLTLGLGVAGVPDMKVISTLTDITQSPEEEKKSFQSSLRFWLTGISCLYTELIIWIFGCV